MNYEAFIASKRLVAPPAGIDNPPALNPKLFEFQRDITNWALRRGRAAIWADCGLGKSPMSLEWSRVVSAYTSKPVLILTPLAVAAQFVDEGEKFGVPVVHCREQSDVSAGVNVTNYERLHLFDPSVFGGVVADESSILKDYTSATRNALIEAFQSTPFRLACTATPAPNDTMELGNHAEFLGIMSRTEMLAMFFTHDGGETQKWRVKGHAKREFWRWVSSWAVSLRKPSDLGYSDDGYELPPLHIHEHVVGCGDDFAKRQGSLFVVEARTLSEQRSARKASLPDRVRLCAELVNGDTEPWVCWCDLNEESRELTKAIPGAVEVTGSDSPEKKEQALHGFTRGEFRVLVSKPSIAGWGLNWQHCANTAFVGVSHSFESWYQAVRRQYRFGQRRAVNCHMITSEAEGLVSQNLRRKQRDAEEIVSGMIAEMSDLSKAQVKAATRDFTDYQPRKTMTIPNWLGQEETAA